jgi:ATP-binding cassette, subfamily B, bacterial
MNPSPPSDLVIIGRLLRQARPWWRSLVAVLLLGILAAPLALLTPVPLKLAVDHVLGERPLPEWMQAALPTVLVESGSALLALAAVLVVVAALLQNLEGYGSWLLQLFVGEKLTLGLKARLLAHVQRLSLQYHDSRGTADSLYRIQYDAPAIQHVLVQGLVPMVTSALTVGAMLYVMARISGQLALVAVAIFPLLLLAGGYYRHHVRARWDEVKRCDSEAMSILQETLGALRIVKAFGQERREERRYVETASRGLRKHLRVVLLESGFGLIVAAIVGGGTALMLYLGVRQVQGGAITLGSLLLVMGYLAQLYKPVETVSKKLTAMQGSIASGARVFSVLEEAHEVPEHPHPRPLHRAHGRITLDHVEFGYRPGQLVIQTKKIELPPGSRVGISGPTGSGKTTLVNLLTRFYDPVAGRLLLDGVDLREYRIADLRRQFAIVLQEPVLFSTTLFENIAYGRPEASRAEIEAAADAANALGFIRKLPEGFETVVGERGFTLSGGERQRISLARAFLKDAPILVLDEPTSSVDLASEAAILGAMERLAAGRTTFMIAHRLNTLERCDVRLIVEDGIIYSQPGLNKTHAPRHDATPAPS